MMTNAETIVEQTQITAVALADVPVVTPPETLLQEWADKITDAGGQAVQKIIDMGRLLLEAKKVLKHGQWERMFRGHQHAIENPVRFSVEMARMLMKIAAHPVLSNGNYSSHLPVSWRTLHELTFLPETDLQQLLATGTITSETTQADVVALRLCQPAPVQESPLPVQKGQIHAQETVDITRLKFHTRNYKRHPDDQLVHIMKSISEHGFYRNIVVAQDNTILAGHGVAIAAAKLGIAVVPVVRLKIDPESQLGLKVLLGDNEISYLASVEDQMRNDVFKSIDELEGTGFDEQQLSALAMLTRPPDALIPKHEHDEWVGMLGYEPGAPGTRLIVQFRDAQDREQFVTEHAISIHKRGASAWSTWWPPQGPDGEVVKWVRS